MSLSYVKGLLKGYEVGEAVAFDGSCFDCGCAVRVVCGVAGTGDLVIDGGSYWHNPMGVEGDFVKCVSCFEANPTLNHFNPCEVYSRCCGYLRPVRQWNLGKKAEWAERKLYKVDEDAWTE